MMHALAKLTPRSMQGWCIVIRSAFKPLCFDDLNTFLGLDTFKNDCLVNASCNRKITICLEIWIKVVGINRLPKCIVIKGIEPLLQILSVFELLHIPSVSHLGFWLKGYRYIPSTQLLSNAESATGLAVRR